MAIDWRLGLGAPDPASAFTQGWQQGGTSNALQRLVANPNDSGAINALAQFNPQAAMQVQGQQQKAQAEAQRQEILRRAYSGDQTAMSEAFGFDPELVMKMDEGSKKQAKEAISFISNAALEIDRLPETQRAQAWANYVQIAESRGMDIPTEYERYSPQVLQATIAEADVMSKLLEGREPQLRNVAYGDTLLDVSGVSRGEQPRVVVQPYGQAQQSAVPNGPDAEDIAMLRQNPGAAAQFDEVFGPGAAQRVLGGGGSNATGNFPGN